MRCNTTKLVFSILSLLFALTSGAQVVELPSLSIEETKVESGVSFDGHRDIYIYEYMLEAATSNKAPIWSFVIDIRGRLSRPQIDPELRENITRSDRQLQPDTTIPVGVTTPDPNFGLGPNLAGFLAFGYRPSVNTIEPGDVIGPIVVESKLPPAWREAKVYPSESTWLDIEGAVGSGVEYSWRDWTLRTEVVAPYDLDESALYDGGGQSPREVNPFLRYESPVESRVHLPAGTEEFDVTVLFGPTTDSAIFGATLDGEDVTSWFRPMAGVIDTVTIPLKPGTTKLKLEILGTTSSGRTARDADTLTFIVK